MATIDEKIEKTLSEIPASVHAMGKAGQERVLQEQEAMQKKRAEKRAALRQDVFARWQEEAQKAREAIPAELLPFVELDEAVEEGIDGLCPPPSYPVWPMTIPGLPPMLITVYSANDLKYDWPRARIADLSNSRPLLPPEEAISVRWDWGRSDCARDLEVAIYRAASAAIERIELEAEVERKREEYAERLVDWERERQAAWERERQARREQQQADREARATEEMPQDPLLRIAVALEQIAQQGGF